MKTLSTCFPSAPISRDKGEEKGGGDGQIVGIFVYSHKSKSSKYMVWKALARPIESKETDR